MNYPPRTHFLIRFVDESLPISGFSIIVPMSAEAIADLIESRFTGVSGFRTIYPNGHTFYQEI